MDTPDQPYVRALLYLHAAGHDIDADTRARLHRLVMGAPSATPEFLLAQLPVAFELPDPSRPRSLPAIARGSMGYPE